jgi:hypothetical protein
MPRYDVKDCSQGVNRDLMPQELGPGVWSAVKNMRFTKGFAERIGGIYDQFDAPSVTPYWLYYYEAATTGYWVHAGLTAVYVDDGTTRTDITGTAPGGAIDDRWTGGTIGGLLVMNNAFNVPQYWNGNTATNLATLTGWDTNWRCKSLRVFKQFIFALNVTKSSTAYPHMVKWSAAALPGALPTSWDATDETLEAREVEIAETPDPIIDGFQHGDSFIVCKERSMYRFTFIDGALVFQSQKLPAPTGMMARGCFAHTPMGTVILAVGDVVLFDGQTTQSIADGQVKEYIFNSMDPDNYERSFVVSNPIRQETLICFPTIGQSACNKAMVWDWKSGKWGERDLPSVTYGATGLIDDQATDTWAAASGTWATDVQPWYQETLTANQTRVMICRTAPAISAYDYGGDDDGTEIESYLRRDAISMGEDGVWLFKDVWLNVDAPAGTEIGVSLGASMYPNQAPVMRDPVTFTVGSTHRVPVMVKGRYAALELSHTGPQKWKIRSYGIGVQPAGKF